MNKPSNTVTVNILDKPYQVSCKDDEKDALLKSAHYLDAQMRMIRSKGNVVGTERIAVMAALNLAHESQKQTELLEQKERQTQDNVLELINKIDASMVKNPQKALPIQNHPASQLPTANTQD